MKQLIISQDGSGCALGMRMAAEGHDVAVAILHEESLHACDGLVPKVEDYHFEPDPDTTVIFDCTGAGWLHSLLRLHQHPDCCGSALMDKLENDRRFAYQQIRKLGMRQPRSWFFTDFAAAHDFIGSDEAPERMVFKPCGENSGNVPSYVSSDKEDLAGMLRYYEREIISQPDFMLQEFIDGLEISTELWFSQGRLLLPWTHNFESKKLMDGNQGASGGCTGCLVWTAGSDRVTEASAALLLPLMAGYSGMVDISTITNPEGVFVLELTPRFPMDTLPSMLWELFDGDLGTFFAELASGQASVMPLRPGFAGGLRLTLPPWPDRHHSAPAGIPIRGIKNFEHFYPLDIERNDDGSLTSTLGGIVGIMTGRGETPAGAMQEARAAALEAIIPDVQCRGDLDQVFQADYDRLQELL